uniref:Uncharacterized protein n=1 Tax=Anguilla anguilla TaxID=7936 RepID=A0A0E9W4G7_ANGAN
MNVYLNTHNTKLYLQSALDQHFSARSGAHKHFL